MSKWSLQLSADNPLIIADSMFVEKIKHVNEFNKKLSKQSTVKYEKYVDDAGWLIVEGKPRSAILRSSSEPQYSLI